MGCLFSSASSFGLVSQTGQSELLYNKNQGRRCGLEEMLLEDSRKLSRHSLDGACSGGETRKVTDKLLWSLVAERSCGGALWWESSWNMDRMSVMR